jgi:hypothetical protein
MVCTSTNMSFLRYLVPVFVLGPAAVASPALKIYQPDVKHNDIYFYNPGNKPALKYSHDVDIIKFKGRFFAAWNANEAGAEDVPGQFNYLSVSNDFENWAPPVRMFTAEGGAKHPVESDNQWQPNFINWKDQVLYCAWSDFVARRVFVAMSTDGAHWTNVEVSNAPADLKGRASGFPTNHGLTTSKGVMLFPCSLPFTDTPRALVGRTQYAGILRSTDGGASWSWSEPIEAISWSQAGEKPAEFGGEMITLWEPMLYEQADGTIGLLIRNSTAQENPERAEKPHRMLLYATSNDQGQTWSKARPVEVDTICSRNYAVGGIGGPDSLLMVMNDNNVRVPDRISHDRYYLSLFCSPTSDPDLLLPGPVIQPLGGRAFYPNGFVDRGKLYVAYTYPQGIHSSVVGELPDFSKPFLLPRGGRPDLRIADGIAHFGQRQSSLGLVLTEKLTKQKNLRLRFEVAVHRYNGGDWPVLTLGGKTHNGALIRAIYSEKTKANIFQVSLGHDKWTDLAPFALKEWNRFDVELQEDGFSVSVNKTAAQSFKAPLLRKICFGGLYVPPEWPLGMTQSSDVRLKVDSIAVD